MDAIVRTICTASLWVMFVILASIPVKNVYAMVIGEQPHISEFALPLIMGTTDYTIETVPLDGGSRVIDRVTLGRETLFGNKIVYLCHRYYGVFSAEIECKKEKRG